jgi:transcriptional regulator with XRE-family HTH domain
MKSFGVYEYPGLSKWSEKLVPKLENREYRHAYMIEGVKSWIARQVRALREQRGWSQGDLAHESGKRQSNISRIEDPDYGQMTLQTLFDLAAAYDLPLLVQFTEWADWLNRMEEVGTDALQKDSFNADNLTARSAWVNNIYSIGSETANAGTSLLTINAGAVINAGSFAADDYLEAGAALTHLNWNASRIQSGWIYVDEAHIAPMPPPEIISPNYGAIGLIGHA